MIFFIRERSYLCHQVKRLFFAGSVYHQRKRASRLFTLFNFGVVLWFPGTILSATGRNTGEWVAGGVLLVAGVILLIVSSVMCCRLKKLDGNLPQQHVTVQQTTTVASSAIPSYAQQTQFMVHPTTTVYQTPQANFQQPVYCNQLPATNYPAQQPEVQQSQGFA